MGYKISGFQVAILSLILAVCAISGGHATEPARGLKNAVLIRPSPDNTFWDQFQKVMLAAAADLNVKLDIVYLPSDTDALAMIPLAREISQRTPKPDVVFFYNISLTGPQIVQVLGKAGIKAFGVNTRVIEDVSENNGKIISRAEVPYANLIGQMAPDDVQVGRDIAEYIYDSGHGRQKSTSDELKLIAISGIQGVISSDDRFEGLKQTLAAHKDIKLIGSADGKWTVVQSRDVTTRLLTQHQAIEAIWAANDNMAIGAVEAIEKAGLRPGQDIIVASVDWMPAAIQQIKAGKIAASMGGHFMDGAAALILAYDYMNGHDFAPTLGINISSSMELMDNKNVGSIEPLLNNFEWDDIDFKRYTKSYNPDVTAYPLTIRAILSRQDSAPAQPQRQ